MFFFLNVHCIYPWGDDKQTGEGSEQIALRFSPQLHKVILGKQEVQSQRVSK